MKKIKVSEAIKRALDEYVIENNIEENKWYRLELYFMKTDGDVIVDEVKSRAIAGK